jgi:hypothetical protein
LVIVTLSTLGTQDPLTLCSDRYRLLDTLNRAAFEYAKLASHMADGMGMLVEDEYEHIRSEVEVARLRAEQARHEYLTHRIQHGC